MTMIITIGLPDRTPNATPLFLTWTMFTPRKTEFSSPTATLLWTSALVTWSRATTAASSSAARPYDLPADGIGHEPPDEEQHEDRNDRAEVEPAHLREDPAEQVEIRLGGVAQEADDRAGRPAVRDPRAGHLGPAEQDVGEDDDPVDGDQRVDVVGDRAAGVGDDHHPRFTASIASMNALRRPACSRASRPRAVDPPGDVTSRRMASVSPPRARSSS